MHKMKIDCSRFSGSFGFNTVLFFIFRIIFESFAELISADFSFLFGRISDKNGNFIKFLAEIAT